MTGRLALAIALPVLLFACDSPDRQAADRGQEGTSPRPAMPGGEPPTTPIPQWTFNRDATGASLVLADRSGTPIVAFACQSGEGRLAMNVPAFKPIGSEERLSFGSSGEVEALVADVRGDPRRGGVTAQGNIPANLAALMAGEISASYGAQTSGPHPAIGRERAAAFIASCRAMAAPGPAQVQPASPCQIQGGEKLSVAPLRAVGTEPFWAASIEGRCVTYSHPDDQKGTRVWTRYRAVPRGGIWSGALGGRLFELRTREEPGCSDGMSDKRYPLAVELMVNGEQRRGCAEPR